MVDKEEIKIDEINILLGIAIQGLNYRFFCVTGAHLFSDFSTLALFRWLLGEYDGERP